MGGCPHACAIRERVVGVEAAEVGEDLDREREGAHRARRGLRSPGVFHQVCGARAPSASFRRAEWRHEIPRDRRCPTAAKGRGHLEAPLRDATIHAGKADVAGGVVQKPAHPAREECRESWWRYRTDGVGDCVRAGDRASRQPARQHVDDDLASGNTWTTALRDIREEELDFLRVELLRDQIRALARAAFERGATTRAGGRNRYVRNCRTDVGASGLRRPLPLPAGSKNRRRGQRSRKVPHVPSRPSRVRTALALSSVRLSSEKFNGGRAHSLRARCNRRWPRSATVAVMEEKEAETNAAYRTVARAFVLPRRRRILVRDEAPRRTTTRR